MSKPTVTDTLVRQFGPNARTIATFVQDAADADDAMLHAQEKINAAIDHLPIMGSRSSKAHKLLREAWMILEKARG